MVRRGRFYFYTHLIFSVSQCHFYISFFLISKRRRSICGFLILIAVTFNERVRVKSVISNLVVNRSMQPEDQSRAEKQLSTCITALRSYLTFFINFSMSKCWVVKAKIIVLRGQNGLDERYQTVCKVNGQFVFKHKNTNKLENVKHLFKIIYILC